MQTVAVIDFETTGISPAGAGTEPRLTKAWRSASSTLAFQWAGSITIS